MLTEDLTETAFILGMKNTDQLIKAINQLNIKDEHKTKLIFMAQSYSVASVILTAMLEKEEGVSKKEIKDLILNAIEIALEHLQQLEASLL